jgi:hypothetical protein
MYDPCSTDRLNLHLRWFHGDIGIVFTYRKYKHNLLTGDNNEGHILYDRDVYSVVNSELHSKDAHLLRSYTPCLAMYINSFVFVTRHDKTDICNGLSLLNVICFRIFFLF